VVEELRKMGKSWSQLTEESIQRLSLKGGTQVVVREERPVVEGGDVDIKGLIKEAERIKELLEKFEASM
jgi:hypothetical protein